MVLRKGFEKRDSTLPRIGVLGASRIVKSALLVEAEGLVEVAAVAARDRARARSYADEHGIEKAYGSYEELISDPEIELIYNALPASGHAPWSIKALRAGKHVLCEKPFGLHVDEARECLDVADQEQRLLMEAHHWRYHPLAEPFAQAIRELASSGKDVQIEALFHGGLNNPSDIRMNPALGPGVLMDFGCYTIQWCVFAGRAVGEGAGLDVTPTIASSQVEEAGSGIDMAASVGLAFEGLAAVRAQFSCDMRDGVPYRSYVKAATGERVVHWEGPLNVEGSHLTVSAGESELSRQTPQGPSTYGGQLRAFLEALRTGSPPLTSGENIVETQSLLDDCYAKSGTIGRRELRESALKKERKG